MREHPLLMKGPLVRATLEGRKTQTRRPVQPWLGRNPPLWSRLLDQDGKPDFDWEELLYYGQDKDSLRHGFGYDDSGFGEVENDAWLTCPFGRTGDRLWVRETLWRSECRQYVAYAADNESRADVFSKDRKWLASTVNLHGECAKTEFQVVSYSNDGPGGWTAGLARLDLTVPIKAFTGNAIVDSADAVFRRKIPGIHMPRWACRLVLPLVSVRVERVQDITEEDAKAEGVERISAGPGWECWMGYGPSSSCKTARDSFRALWISIYGEASWDANPWVWVAEWKEIEVSR